MDGREIGDRVDITILKEIREILQRMEGQLKGIEKNLKKEKPNITFEYEEQTAWGKGFNRDRIINNYLELQSRLKEYGFNSAIHPLTSP